MLSSPGDQPAVQVTDGGVAIDGRPILRHLDLSVAAGEFVALLGANGSGKSTLVRSMTGLRALTSGEVRLFGVPIGDFRDWHRVGYVPQRTSASGGVPATVQEVVSSGRLSRRKAWHPASSKDREVVAEAIAAVGLKGRERDSVSTLSGGQQQRTLIARALAGEPELMFLDEPTAGIDVGSQEALARVLRKLKEAGATIILVAHDLGPLADLIDRMVIMRDGRIAYDGPPLSDLESHDPGIGEPPPALPWPEVHTHHHAPPPLRQDHAPHVASPLDGDRNQGAPDA